jgi:FkbM family methyltransferase
MTTSLHARLYEITSRVLLSMLRVGPLRRFMTWISKVWLRQARIVSAIGRGSFDAVIDGGASVGEFAALARLARPDVPLLCVEPHPPSAAVLRRRGFDVVEAALWHERGTLELRQPTEAVTSCTVAGAAVTGAPSWTVQTLRLDELPISGRNILVKLDLQGAEPQALAGMGALWERCGGLLLEVSYGPQGTYEELRRTLAERGFAESATLNELEDEHGVLEADKLWLRRR